VYKVLGGLNALAWLPGFWLARLFINTLTGVDAGNFTTALLVFTGFAQKVSLRMLFVCKTGLFDLEKPSKRDQKVLIDR
jgi:hypothetical protein